MVDRRKHIHFFRGITFIQGKKKILCKQILNLDFSPAASDYGVRLPILRSSPEDQILYQTERYSEDTFGYDVPIRDEGDYILVLKFAEVYFAQSQQKVRKLHIFFFFVFSRSSHQFVGHLP